MAHHYRNIFPNTSRFIDTINFLPKQEDIDRFLRTTPFDPPFAGDLARVEWTAFRVDRELVSFPVSSEELSVNPSLEIVETGWSNIADLANGKQSFPEEEEGHVLVYKRHTNEQPRIVKATGNDLLALKIAAEKLDRLETARQCKVSVTEIDSILSSAEKQGLISLPQSDIVHEFSQQRVRVFTLQWHLTLQCDLHCKHCYDRSDRKKMTYDEAIHILDEFYAFCNRKHVRGQISFTGGNPILYPYFEEVYNQAVQRGFLTAILGNPATERWLDTILSMQMPEFYQVSLEGLQTQNDYIRGKGFFERVFSFLDLLGQKKIYRLVMLTLTRENLDDVLPLAELLKDRVEKFNFNRLVKFGEGAQLASVSTEEFQLFLKEYRDRALLEPHLGCKDNFFNILQDQDDYPLTGGCTGYGCGAALNFVSLLPDGEVHACRKFPSKIGNVFGASLVDIYQSEMAEKYRQGSSSCQGCRIRHACGGCLAVTAGFGQDIFRKTDPYCFITPA